MKMCICGHDSLDHNEIGTCLRTGCPCGVFVEREKFSPIKDALAIVYSDREDQYGDPVENMVRAAIIMSATLGRVVQPDEIALMHLSYKQVRAGRGHKLDTYTDQAGYSDILGRVRVAMQDGTVKRIANELLGGLV